MRQLALIVFVVGLVCAAVGAARPAPPAENPPVQVEGQPPVKEDPMLAIGRWFGVAGVPFLVGLGLMIAGGIVARRAMKSGDTKDGEGPRTVTAAGVRAELGEIASKLAELPLKDGEGEGYRGEDNIESFISKNAEDIRTKLEDLIDERLPAFVSQRAALIETLGLTTYAEMIGAFSSAERNTHRAWSALIDEAFQEVGPSLDRARASLSNAIDSLPAGE